MEAKVCTPPSLFHAISDVYSRRVCLLFGAFVCMVLSLFPQLCWAEAERDLIIKSLSYSPLNQQVLVEANRALPNGLKGTKLTNPERLSIDIPQAGLTNTHPMSFSVARQGIEKVDATLIPVNEGQGVRITIYPQANTTLDHLKLSLTNNLLKVTAKATPAIASTQSDGFLMLSASAPPSAATKPTPPQSSAAAGGIANTTNKVIIEQVTFNNGTLKLQSQSGKAIVVKSQFILKDPSRVVIDLQDTLLIDKQLSQTYTYPTSSSSRSVRVAQFDDNTVRLVVDTSQPRQVSLYYPNPQNKGVLALTSDAGYNYTGYSPTTGSSSILNSMSSVPGIIEDIQIDKTPQEVSRIHIKTSQPLQQHLIKQGATVQINLPNMSALAPKVVYDKALHPSIQDIRLRTQSGVSGTTLDIDIPTDFDVNSQLSIDNKVLTLSIVPKALANHVPANAQANPSSTSPWFDSELPTIKRAAGKFLVVVDAGHGGKDKGANRVGINEKDLTLSIAHKLKRALEAKGVTVVMTRSTDVFLELSQITGITNRIQPDAFVSVHINSSVNPAANGLETYYYKPQSVPMAKQIHKYLTTKVSSPDRGVRKAMYYVIHHTEVPAVLCEVGYISNTTERNELLTEQRQNATADAISSGVVSFLNQRLKAQAPNIKAPSTILSSSGAAKEPSTSTRIPLEVFVN